MRDALDHMGVNDRRRGEGPVNLLSNFTHLNQIYPSHQ